MVRTVATLSAWIGCGAVLALGLVRWRQRRRAHPIRRRSHVPLAPAVVHSARGWEDHIAARLEQFNAGPGGRVANLSTAGSATALLAPPDLHPSRLTGELLSRLEWKRVEQIVALYFDATGVDARCTCVGADGGVDVKLHRRGETRPYAYVQCKAWGAGKVRITTMREFLGVMAADRVTEGAFVTTSDFWPDARAFAQANGIAPINGADFIARFSTLPPAEQARILSLVTEGDYTTPSCVKCDRKMQPRHRKRDGARFWGCTCGHTLSARNEP